MPDRSGDHAFEQARPALLGLAYRILGSRADAEDAVQDTFLKWRRAEHGTIGNPRAWLATTCTRRAIDMLRAAYRSRVDYVGAWLPEPIETSILADAGDDAPLAASLNTAFMLMLERLTPKERAAYLLHEIFEFDYPQIAQTLDIRETACRKLVSRARANIDKAQVRHVTPVDQQEKLLAAFETAIVSGDAAPFAALLSDDVALSADSGGKVPAVMRTLRGKDEVVAFIAAVGERFWRRQRRIATDLNGGRGVIFKDNDGIVAALSFAYDARGKVTNIFAMRNPDKLARLDEVAVKS
ncbi:MAG: RNA polymerase sigma factor SigJ [Variibacter sp.]